MEPIKGKGMPTRSTVGSIGDIYIDTETGKRYKCTGSYGDSVHKTSDYEWKPATDLGVSGPKPVPPVKEEPKAAAVEPAKEEDKTEEKPSPKPAKPQRNKTTKTTDKPLKEETAVEPTEDAEPTRVNYAASYDKKTK